MKKIIIISIIILIVFGIFYWLNITFINPTTTAFSLETSNINPAESCIVLCQETKSQNIDLSKGPCLGEGEEFTKDWVCDVAHNPRQKVDDYRENQCREFREGRAHHFVEVDENCSIIKIN